MQPIVFLDIDGVLNSHMYYDSDRFVPLKNGECPNHDDPDYLIKLYQNDIDPKSIGFLNELVKDTSAKIVISSTWRNKGKEPLQKILDSRGLVGEIIDVTPHGCECCVRGNEIRQWLKKNGENKYKYVILDDDSDMLWWQREEFLLVDNYIGLTPNDVYKAKSILRK